MPSFFFGFTTHTNFQAASIIQSQIVLALLLAVHISTVPENSNVEIKGLSFFISNKNLVDHLLPHAYPFPVLEAFFCLKAITTDFPLRPSHKHNYIPNIVHGSGTFWEQLKSLHSQWTLVNKTESCITDLMPQCWKCFLDITWTSIPQRICGQTVAEIFMMSKY